MSDKISQFTSLSSAASGDLLAIVDIDDATMAPSGTTKKITAGNLLAGASVVDWVNVTQAPYNADPTGVSDSTTAIQNAINALASTGGIVYLPTGTYKISSALTLTTQVILQGDGNAQSFSHGSISGPTVIKQTSTTAHGVYQNDATQTGIRDLGIIGPGSGTGDGIHLTWTSNTNVYQCDLRNIQVTSFGGHGVYANTLLGSNPRMVICNYNGGDGFHLINTNTSCTWDSCAATDNTGYGWYISANNYCTWNGCAADGNGNGWYLTGCQGCTINGSGTENNVTDGLTIKSSCFAVTVNGFWVSNNHYGVHVDSSCYGITLIGVTESNLGSATWSIYAEPASQTVIINAFVQTAMNLPDTYGTGSCTLIDRTGALTTDALVAIYGVFNAATTTGNSLTQGSGAPSKPTGNNPVAGDIYFRTDTPSTSNQRIYICTVGGATPTWVGIV